MDDDQMNEDPTKVLLHTNPEPKTKPPTPLAVVPKTEAPKGAQIGKKTYQEVLKTTLQDVKRGYVPNDPTARYLLKKITEAHEERLLVANQMTQVKEQLSQLDLRGIELNGIVKQYAVDYDHFNKPEKDHD